MNYLLYLLVILIGVVLGLLGAGGAVLAIPTLKFLFGYEFKDAIPISLASVGLASLSGAISSHKSINWVAALQLGISGALGSMAGGQIVPLVDTKVLESIFVVFLLFSAYKMATKHKIPDYESQSTIPHTLVPLMGFLIGLLSGAVGLGGGFFLIPFLAVGLRQPMQIAIPTAMLLIAVNSLSGFVSHLGHSEINWLFLGAFVMLMTAGSAIGRYARSYVPEIHLAQIYASLLCIISAIMLYDVFKV